MVLGETFKLWLCFETKMDFWRIGTTGEGRLEREARLLETSGIVTVERDRRTNGRCWTLDGTREEWLGEIELAFRTISIEATRR